MHTLQEIEARLAEINTEITTRGAEMTAEELTALEAEVTQLTEERSQLQATAEQRSRILAAVANGQPIAGQGAAGQAAADDQPGLRAGGGRPVHRLHHAGLPPDGGHLQ